MEIELEIVIHQTICRICFFLFAIKFAGFVETKVLCTPQTNDMIFDWATPVDHRL
jgi:hypothetical protein